MLVNAYSDLVAVRACMRVHVLDNVHAFIARLIIRIKTGVSFSFLADNHVDFAFVFQIVRSMRFLMRSLSMPC
jgi:hypothetical protein